MRAKFVFEAIIQEKDFSEYVEHLKSNIDEIKSLDDLNKLSEPYDVFFSTYEDFLEYLDDEEREVAPPKQMHAFLPIRARFGLYNKHLDKMQIVVSDEKEFIDALPQTLNHYLFTHILKHESIHQQQVAKMPKGKELYNLKDSPTDQDKYFSNKWEMMAFAQSMIDEMKLHMDKNKIIRVLKEGYGHPLLDQVYKRFKRTNPAVYKRFLKYAMEYAQQIPEN